MTTYGPRPPLPKLAVGDEVIVIQPNYRDTREHRAKVTKVARVWIDLEEISDRPYQRHWRMRADTQNDGGDIQPNRFVTDEQHAWTKALADATARIGSHGINVGHHSPWHAPERRMLLADLLDQHKESTP